MLDGFERKVDYLRLSVTSKCNLGCIYCVASSNLCQVVKEGRANSPMTPVEIEKLSEIMGKLGIRKVRITGGEPLMRPDLEEIVGRIGRVAEIREIGMTTNGIGLEKRIGALKQAGLKRVNISLDSLDASNYARITRGGVLDEVLAAIDTALQADLLSVRINVVVMQGVNDHEIDNFIEMIRVNPIDLRFIELMPIGRGSCHRNEKKLLLNTAILNAHPDFQAIAGEQGSEPAAYYTIPGYRGRVGLISPISHKFCARCNRIRVTYDGKIKTCLGDNTEVDFLSVLRNDPERLEGFLREIILQKPASHHFEEAFNSNRTMAAIGG